MLSTASDHSKLMTLQACGVEESLPVPTETFPDPCVKIHVDFLEESYHESYRLRMSKTTGRAGDYFYGLTFHADIGMILIYANARVLCIMLGRTKQFSSRTLSLHTTGQ